MNSINSVNSNYNIYVSDGVSHEFAQSIIDGVKNLEQYSPIANKAVTSLDNIIILKDKNSILPNDFSYTDKKFHSVAEDAYGFVSKKDNAIVIIQDNHLRKNGSLEGDILSQGADTLTHEIGHIVDNELSVTEEYKKAYYTDLKNIEKAMNNPNAEINGKKLSDMTEYLRHYTEGADFSDGIDEKDVTREGVRENFAECFSNIVDTDKSEINEIYLSLFPNCARMVKSFCGII